MSFLKNLSMFFGLRDDENYNPEEVDSDRSSIKEKFSKGEVPIQHTSKRFSHFKNLSSDHLNKKLFEKKINESDLVNTALERRKIIAMESPKKVASEKKKIIIMEPRNYSESLCIAKHLLKKEFVLVNFRLVEEYQARRIVDFLTGIVYAEGGDIKRVTNEVFICAPKETEIEGNFVSLNLTGEKIFQS